MLSFQFSMASLNTYVVSLTYYEGYQLKNVHSFQ